MSAQGTIELLDRASQRETLTAEATPEHAASASGPPFVLGAGWWVAVTALAALAGFGGYAYYQQLLHGEVVTGMRTIGAGGATWGLYIVFVVFFIGVSFAGITVAALIRLLDIQDLKPLSRMAELLTIVSLMMGALCVVADLGRPIEGLLNLPRYARTSSPFFGTFSLVIGGYLFASLVYFYLAGRADAAHCALRAKRLRWVYRLWASGYRGTQAERDRHHRVSFWLALLILPLLVTAHSTLGFIFGIQGGRPGWFNALQAPGFVVMAGVSGTGLLIVVAAAIRRALRLEAVITPRAFRWLGNMLLVLTSVYLYFMVAEELTANYAALASEKKIAHEIVFGAYAGLFWTVVGSLVAAFAILFAQFLRGGRSLAWTVAAGLLVNVAAVLKRYLIVVPSQTHGTLLPYDPGTYTPTWVEVGVVAGLFALGTLIYLVFIKLFPIVPAAPFEGRPSSPAAADADGEGGRRTAAALFTLTLLAGLGLAVTGFLLSARAWTQPHLDPVVPYSPVVFILGVMLCFASAAVYELTAAGPRPAGGSPTPR
ncbi:MAG: polysulfide reductase NrfD [Planctomycetes bacterium]|nr:polysulfide reductase NrfD [Planctomycetota bacterium]